ncbi:MAG: hypothetical protein JWN75_800 [Candidatus Saccharibacteria bacterium]|nr:hypothetical protein [Candidatus Saccharibacteria bacterium]
MSPMQKKTFYKITKFLVSGGTAALIEYSSFFALIHYFQELLIMSNIVSFALGLLASFLLNKQWVFKERGDTRRQLLLYFSLALLNLLLSSLLIWLLVNTVGMPAVIAKLFIMAVIATWNYVIFSKLIFINRSK